MTYSKLKNVFYFVFILEMSVLSAEFNEEEFVIEDDSEDDSIIVPDEWFGVSKEKQSDESVESVESDELETKILYEFEYDDSKDARDLKERLKGINGAAQSLIDYEVKPGEKLNEIESAYKVLLRAEQDNEKCTFYDWFYENISRCVRSPFLFPEEKLNQIFYSKWGAHLYYIMILEQGPSVLKPNCLNEIVSFIVKAQKINENGMLKFL